MEVSIMSEHSLRRRVGFLAVVLMVLAATAAPEPVAAQAGGQAASRPAARVGNVAQITAAGFTLESRAGVVTVTVSDQTWVVVEKDGRAVEGTLADLVTGKPAAVAGTISADGRTLAARTVAQGPMARRLADRIARAQRRPAARALQHVGSGTITSISGSTITLEGDRTPEVVVTTRPATIVLRAGFSDLNTLRVGEHVQVFGVPVRPPTGESGTTRTVDAWALRVDSGATGFFHGRVSRIDGRTFVVINGIGRDRMLVNVDDATEYKRFTVSNGQPVVTAVSLADVQVGVHIAVEGAVAPDGRSIAARAVIVLGAPATGGN
jgi:hypothetical protein